MRAFVGTSGYAYKEWKGEFYPEDLPQERMLEYYGSQLNSVEINNTFYRMPRESVLRDWGEQVDSDFRLVLKASRRITHFKRLRDTEDELGYLIETSSVLGQKLGPMLLQLPPNFKKDVPRLQSFLSQLPPKWKAAMEFRHESWFDDETFDTLRETNVALVLADTDDGVEVPMVPTANFAYLRLRRSNYSNEALEEWHDRIAEEDWKDVFVFFKHESAATGPSYAREFRQLFERGS